MAAMHPYRIVVPWMCQSLLVFIALAGEQPPDGQKSPATPPASPVQVYKTLCLDCHDSDGRGEIGRESFPKVPDFTDAAWHSSRDDAQLSKSILDGKKSMPRMRGKLGSVDVKQMVAFVRAFQGGKQVVDDEPAEPDRPGQPSPAANSGTASPRPADPASSHRMDTSAREGARAFQRFCVKCHASDGTGGGMRQSLPTIPDFTVHSWQAARNDPQLIVSVLDGKGAGMPAFRDKLSRDQVRDLIALVRAFDPLQTRSAATSPDEFEARFRELEREFDGLSQKIRALSSSSLPARRETPPRPAPPSSREEHR
jgi:mono/diheme cytochrome c family protein